MRPQTNSEPDNLRCWITGALPEPGYTYAGSSLTWPTIPDVLEAAGISWRIYQDPNDNWTGAMHGGLAFESFRTAKPGSPLYEKGMRHWSLERFAEDARKGQLAAGFLGAAADAVVRTSGPLQSGPGRRVHRPGAGCPDP